MYFPADNGPLSAPRRASGAGGAGTCAPGPRLTDLRTPFHPAAENSACPPNAPRSAVAGPGGNESALRAGPRGLGSPSPCEPGLTGGRPLPPQTCTVASRGGGTGPRAWASRPFSPRSALREATSRNQPALRGWGTPSPSSSAGTGHPARCVPAFLPTSPNPWVRQPAAASLSPLPWVRGEGGAGPRG